jgi:hypothetical protein
MILMLSGAGTLASAGAAIPTEVASATMRVAIASLTDRFMGFPLAWSVQVRVPKISELWGKTVTFGHIGKSILC